MNPVPATPAPATPAPATPASDSAAPAAAALPSVPADGAPEEPLTKTPAPPLRSSADLEPAPWWTTPAQSRLEQTEEEREAARARRVAPRPLDTGVARPLRPAPVQAEKPAAKPAPVTPPVIPPGTPPVDGAAATTVAPAPPVLPVAHDEPESASLALVAAVTRASDPPADGPTGAWSDAATASGPPPRRPTRRTLAWIGGAILIVLIIIGLFFVGIGLGGGSTPAATDSGSATPNAAPVATEAPPAATGPLAAGVHSWSAMFGAECLEPYTSPWDEEFTVVDCATPHTAQLVYRGILDGASGSEFPGEEAMAAQINLLCSAPGVIDFQAASAYTDLQLQGSYPVTTEQWANGDRYYYCFASRSSGEPLTGSLAPVA